MCTSLLSCRCLSFFNIIVGLLIAAPLSSLPINPAQAAIAAPDSTAVRGLSGFNLDLWLAGFSDSTAIKKNNSTLTNDLVELYNKSQNNLEFYQQLLNKKINTPLLSRSDYLTLAEVIYSARRRIRNNAALTLTDSNRTREALLLLETLASETLFSMQLSLPQTNSIWKTLYNGKTPDTCIDSDHIARTAKLNGIPLCQGDILISKGDALSSSFITRMVDYPGNFSHTTLAYVDPKTHELSLPESLIEDGVKLRKPKAEYTDKAKYKFFVYRAKKDLSAAINGVDRYVRKMHERSADLEKTSSYPYDFNMNALDHEEQFCSEVTMTSYELGGAAIDGDSLLNPYPQALWNSVSGIKKDFFNKYMSISSDRYPSPADIELNPNFELIGFQIDVSKIAWDRVTVSMIDSLIALLESNDERVSKYLVASEKFGNTRITPEKIAEFVQLGIINAEQAAALQKQLPANVYAKQALFFYLLNDKLSPALKTNAEIQAAMKNPVGLNTLHTLTTKVLLQTLNGIKIPAVQ